jgi:hypothetical protein
VNPTARRTLSLTNRRLVFAAVWVVSVAYVATRIGRSWGPPDEGLLGQSAERLLNGQLPHRDFTELYTGGLTALHALAFRLFGIRMMVLRAVLLVAVACWVPVLYMVCRRFAGPLLAGAITVLAVVWSVPTYPAPMPSWYNLFLATAGLLALLRYAEERRLRWVAVAGVCAGLSICVKITGIYFLGAAALCIIYYALEPNPRVKRSGLTLSPTTVAGCAAFVSLAALFWLVHTSRAPATYLQFGVPGLAVALALLATARVAQPVAWSDLWQPALALGLGTLGALVPILLVYASQHALHDLITGVFILPPKRLTLAARPPHARSLIATVPLLALAAISTRRRRSTVQATVIAAVLLAGLIAVVRTRIDGPGGIAGSEYNHPGLLHRLVVDSAMALPPILAAAVAALLASRTRRAPTLIRSQAFTALAVASFANLVGFPFLNDVYFFYVAPLMLVTVLALLALWGPPVSPWIGAAVVASYLAFGIVHLDARAPALLTIDRSGGLRVPPADSAGAAAFVDTLRAHARNGYTYATPDCPEAYFLTGLANPTPAMYEVFDTTAGRTDRVLAMLDARQITAVAISSWTIFSGRPDPELLAALQRRYPDSAVVWHFTVRWRTRPEAKSQTAN